MTHIRETANIEALIEDLIKRAGDSLRQQPDNVHREPGTCGPHHASRSASANAANAPLGNTESRLESER
jgi:hypothetical protein